MCIPINEAKDVIEAALTGQGNGTKQPAEKGQQAQGGLTGKPRMGVTVGTSNGRNGAYPKGVYIFEVQEGSPAEEAGLLAGDIIVEVNGEIITSVDDEVAVMSDMKECVNPHKLRPLLVREIASDIHHLHRGCAPKVVGEAPRKQRIHTPVDNHEKKHQQYRCEPPSSSLHPTTAPLQ